MKSAETITTHTLNRNALRAWACAIPSRETLTSSPHRSTPILRSQRPACWTPRTVERKPYRPSTRKCGPRKPRQPPRSSIYGLWPRSAQSRSPRVLSCFPSLCRRWDPPGTRRITCTPCAEKRVCVYTIFVQEYRMARKIYDHLVTACICEAIYLKSRGGDGHTPEWRLWNKLYIYDLLGLCYRRGTKGITLVLKGDCSIANRHCSLVWLIMWADHDLVDHFYSRCSPAVMIRCAGPVNWNTMNVRIGYLHPNGPNISGQSGIP